MVLQHKTKYFKQISVFTFLSSPFIIYVTLSKILLNNHQYHSSLHILDNFIKVYYGNNTQTKDEHFHTGKYRPLDISVAKFYGQKNSQYKPDYIILQRYFRVPPSSTRQEELVLTTTRKGNRQASKYLYRTQGTFVELGALDGVLYSNTMFFEKFLNWSGVLIEPVPSNYRKLQRNRPNVTTLPYAVCEQDGNIEFLGDGATAGSISTMPKEHRNKYQIKWEPKHRNRYLVPCKTLCDIFHRLKINHVDFLSIDVEGGELSVLKSICFNDVSIAVIVIELNQNNQTKDEQCRRLLREHDYLFDMRIASNEYWYHTKSLKKSMMKACEDCTALNSVFKF
eukprot:jgi/Galph1/775/GphlegSOOS_G5517.1